MLVAAISRAEEDSGSVTENTCTFLFWASTAKACVLLVLWGDEAKRKRKDRQREAWFRLFPSRFAARAKDGADRRSSDRAPGAAAESP